jgi:predicted phosphoribosyltransferase
MERSRVIDLPELRNRVHVFRDRAHAGRVLAGMLEKYRKTNAVVLAVPAGGVAVGAVIARELSLSLDVAVVSKITFSWNSEAGYGAVAFDGTVLLNEDLLSRYHLGDQEIEKGTRKTEQKVRRRMKAFRGDRPLPDFKRPIILVDDGLASGFTLRVAILALRKAGAAEIILAVPTAHSEPIQTILEEVEVAYCPNLRRGLSFAVADAYEEWRDLDEEEVSKILQDFKNGDHDKKG